MVGPSGQDTSTGEGQYDGDPDDVESGVQRHSVPQEQSLLKADEEFGGFGDGGVSIIHDNEPSKMKLPAQTTTTVQDEAETKDMPTRRPADTNRPEEEIDFMSDMMQDDALRKNNSHQSSFSGSLTVSFADPEFTAKETFEDDSVSSKENLEASNTGLDLKEESAPLPSSIAAEMEDSITNLPNMIGISSRDGPSRPSMASHRAKSQQALVESKKGFSSAIDLETGKEGAAKAQCAVVRAFQKSHWAVAILPSLAN
jgi:hypothetical protein